MNSAARDRAIALTIFGLTVAQLAVAAFVPGLDQFEGKAFGARLIAYPLMMLIVPGIYWWWAKRQSPRPLTPWAAYAFVWAPFLIDVTGNTLDLYDAVVWWDDANHFVNWFLLAAGAGLILSRTTELPPWALGWLTVGIGAILAITWELGEWYAFIRHGTELATAYEDTLFDEVLGTMGAGVAGIWMTVRRRREIRREA
ncbi:MAG: hypothetical protein ABI720_01035 [Actinomycetes bacterium]